MKTFDDVIQLLPHSTFRKLKSRDYLRGVLDGGYLQGWRTYHNYEHIYMMLQEYIGLTASVNFGYPDEFVVAILFHDVVYDIRARSPENEVSSADVAERCGPNCFDGINWNQVALFIHATTHDGKLVHAADKFMADLDLLTFNWQYDEFSKINTLVKEEYESFFSPELVRQGRLDFLKTFSRRPQIFYHDMIFSNVRAFKNIDLSIEELEGR